MNGRRLYVGVHTLTNGYSTGLTAGFLFPFFVISCQAVNNVYTHLRIQYLTTNCEILNIEYHPKWRIWNIYDIIFWMPIDSVSA